MPARIVVPDPAVLDVIDPVFRLSLPVYDNLEEYSRASLVMALEHARDHGTPLADIVMAMVASNIAEEAPELAEDIRKEIQILALAPTATPEQAYAAVYAGFRFVCDWLDPRDYGRPSGSRLLQTANHLAMVARLSLIEGVVLTFSATGDPIKPIKL